MLLEDIYEVVLSKPLFKSHTSIEMQGFGGMEDPSSGSCCATQPWCGCDSGGGGDAAGAS